MNKAKPSSAPWFYIAISMGLGMLLSTKPFLLIFFVISVSLISLLLRTPDALILTLFASIGFLRGIPQKKTQKILGELNNQFISDTFRLYNESILKWKGTSIELRASMPGFKQGTLLNIKGIYNGEYNTLQPYYAEIVGESHNFFDRIHNQLNFHLLQAFGQYKEGMFIRALLLGDRKGMDRETEENFRRAGAAHLLAISGLHIGFLFLVFNTLLMFILRSDLISRLLASILGGFYTFSLGPLAPCLRAFWFLLLLNVSFILGRKVRALNVWGLTFSFSIFFKPSWLKDPSFLMSYFAILGYLFLSEVLSLEIPKERWVGKWESYFTSVLVPILFTPPLQSFFFKKISLVSLFSNIFLIPLAFLIIFETFFTLIFLLLGLPLWIPFRNCALFLTRLMLNATYLFSKLPGNSLSTNSPASLLIFSLIYIILFSYIRARIKRKGDLV